MERIKLVCLSAVLISGLLITADAQSPCKLRAPFSERLIRSRAVKTVPPGFPEEAVRRGAEGVVVAKVVINEEGDVNAVEIVESPDEAIKQAAEDAIRQWKFQKHAVQGKPICVTGQLTFKYAIEKGKGKVQDAPAKEQ